MEQHAPFFRDPPDLRRGVDGADFIVRQHNGDEDRPLRNRLPDGIGVHAAVLSHREVSDLDSLLLQPAGRIEHRAVLRDGRDEVIPFLPVHLHDPFEGQIVRLRRPAGEDDLLGIGMDETGNLGASRLHGLLGLPSEGVVAARRVAELFDEVGKHRLQDPRIHRRGGVRIHIDG
jgi:hypothetical protein